MSMVSLCTGILYVERFEVLGSFAFTFVIHFSQQVRDLISHDATTPHVGVDEHRPFGGTQDVLKRRVQIDEPPVTCEPYQPRTGTITPEFIVGGQTKWIRNVGRSRNEPITNFDGQVGTQDTLIILQILEPSHVHSQFRVDVERRVIGVIDLTATSRRDCEEPNHLLPTRNELWYGFFRRHLLSSTQL